MAETIDTITSKLHLMAQSAQNYDIGVFQGDNFSGNDSVKKQPLAFVRFKKGSNNKLTANAIRNAILSVETKFNNSNGGKFINGKEEITINNEVSQFKIRSLRSVIGMSFHFMGNVA